MVNVSKYTNPMDSMGYQRMIAISAMYPKWFCRIWTCGRPSLGFVTLRFFSADLCGFHLTIHDGCIRLHQSLNKMTYRGETLRSFLYIISWYLYYDVFLMLCFFFCVSLPCIIHHPVRSLIAAFEALDCSHPFWQDVQISPRGPESKLSQLRVDALICRLPCIEIMHPGNLTVFEPKNHPVAKENHLNQSYTSSTRTSRGRKFPVYKKNINL